MYLMTASVAQSMRVFCYSEHVRLPVVPFDLDAGVLVGHSLSVDGGRLLGAAA